MLSVRHVYDLGELTMGVGMGWNGLGWLGSKKVGWGLVRVWLGRGELDVKFYNSALKTQFNNRSNYAYVNLLSPASYRMNFVLCSFRISLVHISDSWHLTDIDHIVAYLPYSMLVLQSCCESVSDTNLPKKINIRRSYEEKRQGNATKLFLPIAVIHVHVVICTTVHC